MKFNTALLAPIGGTALACLLYFAWLQDKIGLGIFLVALFLQLVGLLIIVLPDPLDTKTDKDASNWRSFTPFILAIIGTFGMALYAVL